MGAVKEARNTLETIRGLVVAIGAESDSLQERNGNEGDEEVDLEEFLPEGISWASELACQVAARALHLRRAKYAEGALSDDETRFSKASVEDDDASRQALQLRIVERRIISTALCALQ